MYCLGGGGIHRRTGQHPFGGGRPSFARMDSVGGGGSSTNFPGSIFCGGGGSSRNFPGSICGRIFPLTAVTDPKFVFFPVNCSNRP